MLKELEINFKNTTGLYLIEETISKYIKIALPQCKPLVEVAIFEALLNAVQHGSKEDEFVKVKLRLATKGKKNKLIVRIKDRGHGFAGNNRIYHLDSGTKKHFQKKAKLMTENGRGLLIMKTSLTRVTYNAIGNEVLLVAQDQ